MPKNIYQIKNSSSSNLTIALPPGTSTASIPVNQGGSASTISIVGGGGGGTHGPIYNTNGALYNPATSGRIHVQGDAVFDGNITWQGRDMREWFEAVENRLGMLRPNPKLEEGWDELKELGDQYRALEKKLLEQQQVFDILKK